MPFSSLELETEVRCYMKFIQWKNIMFPNISSFSNNSIHCYESKSKSAFLPTIYERMIFAMSKSEWNCSFTRLNVVNILLW